MILRVNVSLIVLNDCLCGCITAWVSCSSNRALVVVLARREVRVHGVVGEGTANHDADWGIQRRGWINEACRYRLSQPIIALQELLSCRQTAGHQSHKRQIVAVTSSLMHGSSESLCWVIQHVVTSLSDCFSCLENQNMESKMMFRLCSDIFEHGDLSLKCYLWGEKNSMPIKQNHLLEYNHIYHFWAVMWRVCIIFSADLRLLLCAVFHNRLLTSLIFNNKVCCL